MPDYLSWPQQGPLGGYIVGRQKLYRDSTGHLIIRRGCEIDSPKQDPDAARFNLLLEHHGQFTPDHFEVSLPVEQRDILQWLREYVGAGAVSDYGAFVVYTITEESLLWFSRYVAEAEVFSLDKLHEIDGWLQHMNAKWMKSLTSHID
jgi:hypothetical protein